MTYKFIPHMYHVRLSICLLMGVFGTANCIGNAGNLLPENSQQVLNKPDVGDGSQLRQITDSISQTSPCINNLPTERMIRRLSNQQINKTLQLIWQRQDVPAIAFLSNRVILGLENHADLSLIQDAAAQQLNTYAESVAVWSADKLNLLGINCQEKNRECAQETIILLNKLLLRNSADLDRINAYIDFFLAQDTFQDGLLITLETMLQSPYFLYRTEIGSETKSSGEIVTLTPYEIASLMSFFLTDHGPDNLLRQAAESGAILQTSERMRQADRLLEDPNNQAHVISFFQKWLNVGNLSEINRQDPQNILPIAMKQTLTAESQQLIRHVLFESKESLSNLLTANYSILSTEAANYYGSTALNNNAPSNLPTNREIGLLAQASWLITNADAGNSSPTLRGKIIRTRLLCQNLPPPPPNIAAITETVNGFRTTRERFEQHLTNPTCASCHKWMDPIGVAFENYDHLGRFRTQENGAPIDTNGMIYKFKEDKDVPFNGVAQLMTSLTQDKQIDYCMIRFWSYQAFGLFGWQEDACTHNAIEQYGQQQQNSLHGMLEGIIASPSFTQRVVRP